MPLAPKELEALPLTLGMCAHRGPNFGMYSAKGDIFLIYLGSIMVGNRY